MREVAVQHGKNPDETWMLRASDAGLELEHAGERFVVPAGELAKRATLADGVLVRGILSLDLAGRKPRDTFRLDDTSTTELLRGVGPDIAVRWLLGQRVRFLVVVAIVFVLSSLPIPGDAEAGIEPIAADWLGATLGLGLLVLAGAARLRPQAWLFVFDAGWLFLLAIKGVSEVLNGSTSPWWLLLNALIVVMGMTSLRLYRRLREAGASE